MYLVPVFSSAPMVNNWTGQIQFQKLKNPRRETYGGSDSAI